MECSSQFKSLCILPRLASTRVATTKARTKKIARKGYYHHARQLSNDGVFTDCETFIRGKPWYELRTLQLIISIVRKRDVLVHNTSSLYSKMYLTSLQCELLCTPPFRRLTGRESNQHFYSSETGEKCFTVRQKEPHKIEIRRRKAKTSTKKG